MNGAIYQSACMAVDTQKFVAQLTDANLAGLMTYLKLSVSGIPALILRIAETEAGRRWMALRNTQTGTNDCAGAMGEGSMP